MKTSIASLRIFATATLVASTLFTGCSNDSNDAVETPVAVDIPAASSTLDKAYVPSLFYSNISPTPNAMIAKSTHTALGSLQTMWAEYKSAVGETYDGHDISGYFTDIDDNIEVAAASLQSVIDSGSYPADISIAHAALESVRDRLGDMRDEIGIDYFMDYVTTAHHAMEPVAGAAKQYADNVITLDQLCTSLESSLPAFSSAWEALQSKYDASATAALYHLSTPKSTNISNNIGAMSARLTNLSAALPECGSGVATEAGKIKPVFVKMFLGFSDFITPFMDEMIAMEKVLVSGLYCTNNPPDVEPTCGGLDNTRALIENFGTLSSTFQQQYPIIQGKLNLPATIYWSSNFTAINTAIVHAKTIAENATTTAELIPAHDELEAIRVAMYELRWSYENFAFVMDRVTEYHNAMEPIAIAVKGMTDPAQVDQSAKDAISAALPTAQNSIAGLEEAVSTMDIAAFGFDEAWHTAQMGSVAFQFQNLDNLEAALEEDNATAILQYAQMVKPKFVGLFKAFGAF